MKTAEEILDSKHLHWTYYPQGDTSKQEIHDCDCRFCESEDRVLEAMEEYADQFKATWVSTSDQLPPTNSTLLTIANGGSIFMMYYGLGEDRGGTLKDFWFYDDNIVKPYLIPTHWMPLPTPPQY